MMKISDEQRIKFDNQLKSIAEGVYEGNEKSIPNSWDKISYTDNYESGFHGEAFSKNGTIVIAFRGTEFESKADIHNDLEMGKKNIPPQFEDAYRFYEYIKSKYPNNKIVFTGQSLGGSLTQMICGITGHEGVAFNPYGAKNLFNGNLNLNSNNIRNYGNINDTVFKLNFKNHIGKMYIITDDNTEDYIYRRTEQHPLMGTRLIKYHGTETMGELEDAIEYTPYTIKGGISFDYKDIDPKRIITREELGGMSKSDFAKQSMYISKQFFKGNVISEARAQEMLKSGELIWVDAYVRDDGTHVSGYYRRK